MVLQVKEKESIALYMAAFSIFLTLIAIVVNWRKTQHVISSQRELEESRQEFEKKLLEIKTKKENLQDNVDAIRESVASIQRFKDELKLFMNSVSASLDRDASLSAVINSRKNLFEVYEKCQTFLAKNEEDLFYGARDMCLEGEEVIRRLLNDKHTELSFLTEDSIILERVRNELSDIQHQLQSCIANKTFDLINV